MDETLWGLMDIIGPAILLVLLIWLVMRRRSNRRPDIEGTPHDQTEAATDRLYDEEERRRREGTDGL
jgi:hypothetical protein